jgi:hypothetical protein
LPPTVGPQSIAPVDATKQIDYVCTGGGPDAWASCGSICIEICAHASPGITCGVPGCGAGDVCCIPSNNERTCATGSCPVGSATRACDGPEDCANGGLCCGGAIPWTASCSQVAECGSVDQFCHTEADCPSAKPYCCPNPIVEDMRICSANDAPTCT